MGKLGITSINIYKNLSWGAMNITGMNTKDRSTFLGSIFKNIYSPFDGFDICDIQNNTLKQHYMACKDQRINLEDIGSFSWRAGKTRHSYNPYYITDMSNYLEKEKLSN